MLQITSGNFNDCEGISRRNFLRAGALGIGGLSLSGLLAAKASASDVDFVRNKSVVLIFLAGGASHIETFNPNMTAPAPACSVTGEVKTTLPGVTFGGTFPLLAEHAKNIAVVRSFQHSVGSHGQAISHILTGGTDPNGQGEKGSSMGSMFAKLRGTNDERTGLPTYHLLLAQHKDGQYSKELGRVKKGSRPGSLGSTFGPFVPGAKGPATENMELTIPAKRLDDRRTLLTGLDQFKRHADSYGGYDRFQQQAVDVLLGGAADAFNWEAENPKLIERYDTSEFLCGKKVFQPSVLGKQLLMTRRLLESGAGFVTVQSAGWDMHADGNNPGVASGMEMLGRPLDKALSAFLTDLADRGMLNDTLVVLTGDFGRTPKVNSKGGRDHWAKLCTLAFMGGGLNMGQVIGQSNRSNAEPATTPWSTGNFMATVMHTLFDAGQLRLSQRAPADLRQLVERNKPIKPLFS